MFTDMVGSTIAAQTNEARALRLRDEQASLVRPLFHAHHGREIKSLGDGFLAEFDSALHAVECAIDIQQHLSDRNSRTGGPPIELRIGVHLGDVEERDTDIFGDAVNIASRIEPLALPGGVCISGEVFSQVRNKIPNRFEKLPPTPLKGVQVAMDVYRIALPGTGSGDPLEESTPTGIAVLPFASISPDPNDAYFADGLTEELITVLSQLRGLRVIARTSVLPYRSTSKGVSEIGKELGVASILEGSVRKAGTRLRITVQLIDVATQGHLWASTYDRELVDVFAIQAEIAREVAEALKITLHAAEEGRLETRPTVRPDSYLAYLKGRALLRDRSAEVLAAAKEQFELAVRLDGRNASAYSGLSDVAMLLALYVSSRNASDIEASRAHALHALELDPGLAEAHASLAHALTEELRYAEAEQEFRKALSLNPSYSPAHHWYSLLLAGQARPEEAVREISLAEKGDPLSVAVLSASAMLFVLLRRMDEAALKLERLGALENFGTRYHITMFEFRLAQSDSPRALQELVHLGTASREHTGLIPRYAFCYALNGERDRALACIDQLLSAREGIAFREDTVARIYAVLGDIDESFRWLDRAVDIRAVQLWGWRLDPFFRRVRDDPRFQRILEKLNLV